MKKVGELPVTTQVSLKYGNNNNNQKNENAHWGHVRAIAQCLDVLLVEVGGGVRIDGLVTGVGPGGIPRHAAVCVRALERAWLAVWASEDGDTSRSLGIAPWEVVSGWLSDQENTREAGENAAPDKRANEALASVFVLACGRVVTLDVLSDQLHVSGVPISKVKADEDLLTRKR